MAAITLHIRNQLHINIYGLIVMHVPIDVPTFYLRIWTLFQYCQCQMNLDGTVAMLPYIIIFSRNVTKDCSQSPTQLKAINYYHIVTLNILIRD